MTADPSSLPPPASGGAEGGGYVSPEDLAGFSTAPTGGEGGTAGPAGADRAPAGPLFDPSVFTGACKVPFSMWARRSGDPSMALTDKEAADLAPAVALVVSKWLPVVAEKWGPEVNLILVAAPLILDRLGRVKPQPAAQPQPNSYPFEPPRPSGVNLADVPPVPEGDDVFVRAA